MEAHMWSWMSVDINAPFLNSPMHCDLYFQRPCSDVQAEQGSHVYLLTEALFGQKQAAPSWYQMFDKVINSIVIQNIFGDTLLYKKYSTDTAILNVVYVDGVLRTGRD